MAQIRTEGQSGMDPLEDNTKENEGISLAQKFGQSFLALDAVSKLMACVKCGKVPVGTDKVFMLGNCPHKYCFSCVESFSERSQICEVESCGVICQPGKVAEDIFSTSLVAGLDSLKKEMNKSARIKNVGSASGPLKENVVENRDIVPPVPLKRSAAPEIENSVTITTTEAESITESVAACKPVPAKRRNKSRCFTPDTLDSDENIGDHSTPVASTPLPATRGRPRFTPSSIESAESKSTSAKSTPDRPLSRSSRRSNGSFNSGTAETRSFLTALTQTPIRALSRSSSGSDSPTVVGNVSLLSNSGKVDKKNAKGETPLHVSCRTGQLEKARQLILAGADPNAQDHAGWTPLHEAINGKGTSSCKLDLVKLLCEEGSCNPNIPGLYNESALHEAARGDLKDVVVYLLAHGASPNVRNQFGKLPRDVAISQEILQILEETSVTPAADVSMINDPVVLEIQLSNAVVYFSYGISADDLAQVEQVFKLKVSKELGSDVTHMVFKKDGSAKTVPFSYQYLQGIAIGAWMLSSEWIDKSITANKVLSPCEFELDGCDDMADPGGNVPKSSRLNRELGNPGLFHGFCFYFYKNCSCNNPFENIEKKNLIKLAKLADGIVLNREPQPGTVEPLENPERFHLKQENNHKLAITSHIILYDDKNRPPPSKMHNMEHIKVLKTQWFMESLVNFSLKDPEAYL